MSIINDLRAASEAGRLPKQFTAQDCQNLKLRWDPGTYSTFLPKHCLGNPGNYSAYFLRVNDGLYELLPYGDGNKVKTREYRYQQLNNFLVNAPSPVQTITLSFQQVEIIIRAKLPDASRKYRPWWANQKVGNRPQAESWMKAGFKVDKVDLTCNWVKFTRI